MELKEFAEMLEGTFERCRELMGSKSDEYARGDKLSNFKTAAAFKSVKDPRVALGGMMLKHTVSVYDMLNDLEVGKEHPLALWDEKIFDHINYLILLRAILLEMKDAR